MNGAGRGRSGEPTQPQPRRPETPANIRIVKSTKFAIDYQIDELGKSGVASVKLYFTHDGKRWELFGEDEDTKTPFPVEVDGEGLYGFYLTVTSGAGLGDPAPQAGDPPQVWIEVDLSPPTVTLAPPEAMKDTGNGILTVQWNASDRNMAGKGISLSYSESATGPWKEIAAGIENTGKYVWKIPADAPYKFFVQVEARDKADNVAKAVSEQPTIVDFKRPRLKITGVNPGK